MSKPKTKTRDPQRARRARQRRLCQEIEMAFAAVFGERIVQQKQLPRVQREMVARLLGYDPARVLALFVLVAEGS